MRSAGRVFHMRAAHDCIHAKGRLLLGYRAGQTLPAPGYMYMINIIKTFFSRVYLILWEQNYTMNPKTASAS